MCIAILQPPGTKILTRAILKACWDNNNDGGGIMFARPAEDKLFFFKELKSFRRFWKFYKRN